MNAETPKKEAALIYGSTFKGNRNYVRLVVIESETKANYRGDDNRLYDKKSLHQREDGPTSRTMSKAALSFDETDIKKAREVMLQNEQEQQERAAQEAMWEQWLTRPPNKLASLVVNRIMSASDSREMARRLSIALDPQSIERLHTLLVAP
jgi:hypothetical protein